MRKTKKAASPVSRSVYQKLKEENKRLLADLKLMCYEKPISPEAILTRHKWKKHFKDQDDFKNLIRATLKINR